MSLLISGLLCFTILIAPAGLFHLVGPIPPNLGIGNGHLSSCESTAHCARQNWRVDDADSDMHLLAEILNSSSDTEVVELTETYLHATVSSPFFGFVDDLELLADKNNKLIEARSTSRLGQSDLGVNLARLNALQKKLKSLD